MAGIVVEKLKDHANLEANAQQASSLPVQKSANPQNQEGVRDSNARAVMRALEEVEFEMINIRGTYYGDATYEQAQAMQEPAQELHLKLTNIGLNFNHVGNILMLPRQQKLMKELVIHKGFVDGKLRELSSSTIQSLSLIHI